ncbi:WD40 repeat domain-containing protein [Methanothermococcus sp.]|uniref:WD40 repeat domain-containing protein n=1 Tax=Methanothermococcus sp. TaxID=2614238 RepID=UPI0025F386A2|nr:hypothetical protein [Methanothermococcus sp.]
MGSVHITSDGKYIVAGSGYDCKSQSHNGSICLFNTNGDLLWKYDIIEGWIDSISITPDGKYIVAGGNNGYVYLFNNKKILNNNIQNDELAKNNKEIAEEKLNEQQSANSNSYIENKDNLEKQNNLITLEEWDY